MWTEFCDHFGVDEITAAACWFNTKMLLPLPAYDCSLSVGKGARALNVTEWCGLYTRACIRKLTKELVLVELVLCFT